MAIAFRAATTRAGDVNSGSTTVARPSGLVVDDVMIAVVARSQTAASVTSFSASGWTSAGFFAGSSSTPPMAVLWKVATAADVSASSFSFTSNGFSSNDQFNIHCLAFSGVHKTTPIQVAPVRTDTSGGPSTATAPSVSPTGEALLVSVWAGMVYNSTSNAYTWAPPASMTLRSDQGGQWLHHAVATEARAAAGATGTRVATFRTRSGSTTSTDLSTRGVSFALNPGTTIQKVTVGGTASAEASGTPTMVPGGVTVGPVPGVDTAEASGTPWVAPAQDVGPVPGVGTAEAAGVPTVTPGTAYLRPPGTAPGGSGTPKLTPGDITIGPPPGTESSEASGEPVLQFGIAASDLPRAYPRTEIPYPAVAYELVCVARVPQVAGPPLLFEVDPIDWVGLSFTDELSKPQTLSASCNLASLTDPVIQRIRDLSRLGTELWLYRNGVMVFAGPLLGWQVQGSTVTFNAGGLLSYLKWYWVMADLVFAGVDQNLIVKRLIDQWQELPYGHFGLDTTGITTSGVTRDATYLKKELHNVQQRVFELGLRQDGFDIEADPTTRDVRLWYPAQGVDRSEGEDAIIFDDRNVTSGDVLCSSAPGDVASDVLGVGTGNDSAIMAEAGNEELRQSFGRAGWAQTFDGVSEQATLDSYTAGALDARDSTLLVPGPGVRTTADADLVAYGAGDTVGYQVHEELGVTGAFRIRKRTVSVSKIGREQTSLEFV